MLENLFNLVKEQGIDTVINNPVIPNEKNDEVIADATHSVADGLQSELASGGLPNILSMFGKNNNNRGITDLLNNPIVSNIISKFTNKLINKHGVSEDEASGIAGSLIPDVISSLINKTNDPDNNSFDLGSLIGSLSNNAPSEGGINLQDILSKFSNGGLDMNGDGKLGFDDIMSKITGGAKKQQEVAQQEGGSLMDTIKGFFK
ncbi:MAG: hypothetical protein ABIN01_04840 [Ferruginibacter sp.]